MTEFQIQNALKRAYCRRYWPCLVNVDQITGHEADFICFTRSMYPYEFEIKTSLSDFRADKYKRRKHELYSGTADPEGFESRPRKFYYVCSFDIRADQVPEYSGLIHCSESTTTPGYIAFNMIKEAPNLTTRPTEQIKLDRVLKNMLFRYWNLREKSQ